MSTHRIPKNRVATLIEQNRKQNDTDLRFAAQVTMLAYDAEDARYQQSLGWMQRILVRRFAGWICLFCKQAIITTHERGMITSEQTKALFRSIDHRLWPDGKPSKEA